jgi:hypothetical protein
LKGSVYPYRIDSMNYIKRQMSTGAGQKIKTNLSLRVPIHRDEAW